MGANISLNGVHLGTANDQFLRFVFPVTAAHLLAANGGAHEVTQAERRLPQQIDAELGRADPSR